MTDQKNSKTEEFISELVDILLCVEGISAGGACDLLEEMGFDETVYNAKGTGCKVSSLCAFLKDPDVDASEVKGITFQGGPDENTWFTLSLQEVLEDVIYRCCFKYGTKLTASAVGVRHA